MILAVVALLLHAYVYGIVPPVPLAVAPPSEKVLQVTLLSTATAAIIRAGSVTVPLAVSVQPFASVIVTVASEVTCHLGFSGPVSSVSGLLGDVAEMKR